MAEETNKKLQYFKRDDVRTLEKDMALLREKEAEAAREKVVHLRTEQELQKEAERMEQLKKIAEEKGWKEAEAKRKEEEFKRMKEERERKAAAAEVMDSGEAEKEKEKLRAQFRETQLKEEEERRKFLEDVAAKAEGREIKERPAPPPIPPKPVSPMPPQPAPPSPPAPIEQIPPIPAPSAPTPLPIIEPTPPLPPAPPAPMLPKTPKKPFKFSFPKIRLPKVQLPKVQMPKVRMPKIRIPKVVLPKVSMPKVEGYFPARVSIFEKIWIRIIISLFVLAILATIITFWYWYLVVREKPVPNVQPAPAQTPTPASAPIPEEITKPQVIDRILTIGYRLPKESRNIDTIVIHSVYNNLGGDPHSIEGIIEEYKLYKVAAHYLITREGTIYQTAPDKAIAYHAGISQMPDGRTDVNNFSIGIELINTKEEPPAEAQYQSLSRLVKYLQKEYGIPKENILGHKDLAPDRKTDPWNFDFEYLKSLL